jgi:hypothetical protein
VTLAPVVANDWTSGWTVTTGPVGSVVTLETKDAPASVTWTAPASIVFSGNGRTTGAANVVFTVHSTEFPSVPMRCITISPSGRPNIKTDSNGDSSDGCN